MLKIRYSNHFKKDFKKVRNLPLPDLKAIFEVISTLEKGLTLDKKYKDHELSGNWAKFRECHIKPDQLLIYKINSDELQLARLGTHSDLF
ncbi:mRNA interferase YafQ [Bathymodiolus platifrons methanotrophic gill symbiont]|uniref:type II toxin-antitoxin system YafQ family toxin n=1 Tax=Bathymodiolus platifrons methanotrophic gill symbiont TaxID=113268 RepID=UPI000B4159C3|nr:type II toxin-antitoxin system YafQ family toxin [Bathymodiolus platifrons methanotrophic gill symbiont]TXK93610.1 type II toxin-antitoxin system mRNA interferase toxin, RelE/StbE family [Methylococcaceae bacterium CS5]TXK95108.1 type II toxin-antitoxin system mRNA interferase toxin, RelE/StbE family [Methylococcaceae bacterium HT1]TXK95804.1 type II toxin-antitoxin system mRNA interferase toxin, RelE/StbE family [Methylococcaceae bacterium CS4]TXL03914.1 type II toxin-antitoxin system mRNA 